MATKKRPGLAAAVPAKEEAVTAAAPEAPVAPPKTSIRDTYRGMTIYLPPADHKRLKVLALEHDTTIAGLIYKGVNKVLEEYGQPPINSDKLNIAP